MNNKLKDVFYLYIIATLILTLLFSCNPVKQVLRDETKMREVWNEGALAGWCVNDSVFINKSDTITNFDTLYTVDYLTDTVLTNSVQTVTKYATKIVTKTVTIRDTIKTVIVDNSRVDLLGNEILKQNGDIENLKSELEKTRKQRNGAYLYLFGILALLGIYVFRKPLLTFASGGWSKLLGVVKR